MATIKDVAKLAGVALSTASCALNGDSRVRASTRLRVLDAAKQLNYQKNGLATDLKRNSSKTIALVLQDLSGPYYSELIRGVQEITRANGYDLIACSSMGGADSTAIKFLTEKRSDGVIVLAVNIPDETILTSARAGFPIVLLDRHLNGEFITRISVDNVQGGKIATDYLIEMGHTEIGMIGGATNSLIGLRYKGFQESLRSHGLEEQSKWVLQGKLTREGGYEATQTLLRQDHLPTAVFYINDEMAIGGMQAFEERGMSIPNDISIVGFDDIELAAFVKPALTTVRQPKYEIGILAAEVMFQQLGGEQVKQRYILETELVERKSCRRSQDGKAFDE